MWSDGFCLPRGNLFILTSFWEGFGHVIVESLVCKTPVICCNTVGINNDFLGGKEVQTFQCKETKDIGSRLHDIINNYVKPQLPDSSFVNQYRKWYLDLINQMKSQKILYFL